MPILFGLATLQEARSGKVIFIDHALLRRNALIRRKADFAGLSPGFPERIRIGECNLEGGHHINRSLPVPDADPLRSRRLSEIV